MKATLAALALACAFAAPTDAAAQAYPRQPIKVIVPFSPGTGMDIIARVVGPKLTERWGQGVVVENRPGASGNIGTAAVARAAPDGYTLLSSVNTMVVNKSAFKDPQYDPVKDFAPLSLTAWGRLLLVVHPSTRIQTASDLVRQAKAAPGKLNYASPGIGTPHHISMELLKIVTGTDLFHVPHKATSGAVTDLLGGNVQAMFLPIHVALTQVRAGKLVALGVGSPQRSQSAPDIPTLGEQGMAGVDVDMWYGWLAPAGTPRDVVARLNQAIVEILATPDMKGLLAKQGLEAETSTPEAFRALIEKDVVRWAKVVEQAKISAE